MDVTGQKDAATDTPAVSDIQAVIDAGVVPRDDGAPVPDRPDAQDVPDADGGTPDANVSDGDADVPPACPAGQTSCGNVCADTSRSAAHCGACNAACASGTTCVLGRCAQARIDAIYPAIVDRGANTRVCLEGVFPEGVTVTFPGVATPVTPAVAGPRRVCVDVPAGATAGGVRVVAGGMMSDEVSFRRTSFLAGLQTFRARYEQADYARQTPALNEARAYAASFATDRWVYLLGGRGADGMALRSGERALINADGSLGRFEPLMQSTANPRDGAAAVRVGRYVYVIGGDARGTIERATINPDGTLGMFEPAGALDAGMDVTRRGLTAVLVGGSVCLVGGRSGSNAALRLVTCAPIAADGSLGAFAPGPLLNDARADAAVTVIGDQLCAFGGSNGTAAIDSVECAAIARDGTLGEFMRRGALGTAREGANVVALGSRAYVIGGRSGSADSIEFAEISPTGTFGAFSPLANRAPVVARRGASMFVVGNYVYRVGGLGVTALASIERAQIIATGSVIGTFAPTPMDVRSASYASLFAVGDRLCAISGSGDAAENGITCAPVARDGSIGAFGPVMPATPITPGRDVFLYAVIEPWLYQFGGTRCNAGNCVPRAEVHRARLGPQGPVGGFQLVSGVTLALDSGRVIVIGDSVYSISGVNATGAETATFNRLSIMGGELTNGRTWSEPGVRVQAAAAILGEHLVVFGGRRGSTIFNTIERASIGTQDDLGAFAATATTLAAARSGGGPWGAVIGDRIYLFGGFDGTQATATIQSATIDANGNPEAFRIESRALPFGSTFPSGQAPFVLGNYLYASPNLRGVTPTPEIIQRAEIQ